MTTADDDAPLLEQMTNDDDSETLEDAADPMVMMKR
jgi:hypothetical protein